MPAKTVKTLGFQVIGICLGLLLPFSAAVPPSAPNSGELGPSAVAAPAGMPAAPVLAEPPAAAAPFLGAWAAGGALGVWASGGVPGAAAPEPDPARAPAGSGPASPLPDALAPRLQDGSAEAPEQTGQAVVELAAGVDPARFARAHGLELTRRGPLNFIAVTRPAPLTAADLAGLRRLPEVLSAEPSRTFKLAGEAVSGSSVRAAAAPSDPFYDKQWALAKTAAAQAWALGATGRGITVAVIDTGVDLNHPDLQENLVPGYNAIYDSTDPADVRDDNGHGTHVAGIIAAGRNGLGVVGVAYEAKIMPVKAMDRNGDGADVDVAAGIVWAADHRAQIINLSLGAGMEAEVLRAAIRHAAAKGALIVAAAGNYDAGPNPGINYPAADPDVLAVTSVDSADKLSVFSCTGPQAALAAPGERILSTYWSRHGGSAYAESSGTSMAAPLAAGVAALVWSRHPDWSAREVRSDLEDSARRQGPAGRNELYGYGIVDAFRSVAVGENPAAMNSPAQVSLAGATIASPDGYFKLTVPPLAFAAGQTVTVQAAAVPAEFPDGIEAGGQAYAVSWSNPDALPQKILSISASGAGGPPPPGALGYVFRWSGSRWLLVGGGQAAMITAGVFEPGIYRVGYLKTAGNRLAGPDRLGTAVKIAEAAFPTGADTVIVARADDFPDALAGAPLAYKLHAPILLAYPDKLDPAVRALIQKLGPKKIIVLGGSGAISAAVAAQLNGLAPVERLAGADRYATAAAIARALGTTGRAMVASGENFPDALALAPVAARSGQPILLAPAASLDPEAARVLRELYVTATASAGGEGVLARALLDQLPSPLRLAGADRYGTAAAVLEHYPPRGLSVLLATGEDFPDALSGGVLAASRGTDLALLPPAGPGTAILRVLAEAGIQAYIALGGSAAVADSLLASLPAAQ